jgi:hypothetical protein
VIPFDAVILHGNLRRYERALRVYG